MCTKINVRSLRFIHVTLFFKMLVWLKKKKDRLKHLRFDALMLYGEQWQNTVDAGKTRDIKYTDKVSIFPFL